MHLTINEDLCTGCELCVHFCPEIFDMNNEGKAVTRISFVPSNLEDIYKEASEGCPVEAISIHEMVY